MKNLWSYGPSVAQLTDYRTNHVDVVDEQWINQIANKLNIKHNAYGLAGTSIEYVYKKFHDTKNLIQENDVIIVVTAPIYNRYYFFEDRPNVATIHDEMSKDELAAFKQYIMHLDKNNDLKKINLYNFVESLNRTTKEKNTKTIIMSAWEDEQKLLLEWKNDFPNVYIVNDNLVTIVTEEFDKSYSKDDILIILAEDKRFCHMVRSNHTILANKFIEHIQLGKDIVFDGFIKEIINKDFFKKDMSNELFGLTWFK